MKRPDLTKYLDPNIFSQFYYLKSELVVFCRNEDMQTTGNKQELTERISHYLFCGEKLKQPKKKIFYNKVEHITLESKIESPFVCSEVHRKFYKDIIDNSFSFIVPFQKWLKQNTGKTYQDSIASYYQILIEKKNSPKKLMSHLNTILMSEIFSAYLEYNIERYHPLLEIQKITRRA